eukprot:scaffold2198_cov109-Skeletonema_marinoi.AAC.1
MQTSTQHYAIIFNKDPSEAAQDKITGELVKLKRILIPSDDYSRPEKESNVNILYLCIYEELSTQIICNGVTNRDAKQSYLNSYVDQSCTILDSESSTSIHDIQSDCIDSIASAISSWHANSYSTEKRDVSRADVESVCNIIWPSVQLDPAIVHYCSCNEEECAADQFISSLRLDLDANARYGYDAIHKQSDSSTGTPLRLIITGEPTSNSAYDIFNSTQMSLKTLRRSISTMPLISLILQPGGDASECASILDDHLLRACVKRLLTGRAKASSNMSQEASHTKAKEIEPEKTTCRSKPSQNITTPHQHLVESLRILVQSSGQQHRPLIPRVFLFSGPPGVGKTYAVKKAISIANSWVENSSNNDNTVVRLVSIRGLELLAMSGGSHATTARALEGHFEEAAKLCQSRNRDNQEADAAKAVVVFLDECDALVSSHVVAAMLALLLDKMEGVVQSDTKTGNWGQISVVGATNRVDVIPAFLRRPGRMEKEVVFSPPNADERFSLLDSLLVNHDIP